MSAPIRESKRNPKRRWWVSVLRIVTIAYVTVLVMLVVMESRLVFPGAYMQRDIASVNHGVEPFEYRTADGASITGRRLDRPGSQRVLLFFHGNGVRAVWMNDWAMELSLKFDANVVLAEYRGFQDDSVTPSEANLIEDSLAVHSAVCDHYSAQPEEIILYGRSLGGGCAAAIAGQRGCRMLVLDRTFDSIVNVAAKRFSIFPVRRLMRNRFDSVARLSDYHGHVIQIHGTTDGVVPPEHGKRLHQSIPSQKKVFLELEGVGHNDRLPKGTLESVERLISNSENKIPE